MIKKRGLFAILFSTFILFSCGQKITTTPGFSKDQSVWFKNAMEASPVVFKGKLIVILSERSGTRGIALRVIDYFTKQQITYLKTPDFGLSSAFVDKGILYVYGSSDWGTDSRDKSIANQNIIKVITTSDLVNWSPQKKVWSQPKSQAVFNTSISKAKNGYVMTYEIKSKKKYAFTPSFLYSNDLFNWTEIGIPFDLNNYAACPTIRYENGWYYLFYLSKIRKPSNFFKNSYLTKLSRSRDLKFWQHARHTDFQPTLNEGINNSDLDLAAFGNKLYFIYADGDQANYANLRTAVFNGTQEEYFQSFKFKKRRSNILGF